MSEQKSFWQTVPGILTAIAGLITAIVSLITILHSTGLIGEKNEKPKQEVVKNTTEVHPDNQELLDLQKKQEDKLKELEKQKLLDKQKELDAKIARMEKEMEDRKKSTKTEIKPAGGGGSTQVIPPPTMNINGYWLASNGFTYFFDQAGSSVLFDEITYDWWNNATVTAQGRGTANGNQVNFNFTAADGSVGTFKITVSSGLINATIYNQTYGTSNVISMYPK